MKKLLATTVLALAAGGFGSAAMAQNTFALVPKNMNNPFFDQARDGCMKAAEESGGKFKCEYIGPGEHGGGDEQVQIVQDLVARGDLKGIGVSPANAAAMAVALQAAKDAGIPVITWDSDLLPENKDLRVAYIGTHNYEIGVEPRQARAWRSSPRAARSASSPAALRRPTTTSACRASATPSAA